MRYFSSIVSSTVGNILEWYDFGLFTIFSGLFSQLFFPSENPTSALLATFGIFAVGFLCRPLGALLFGYLGDRKGRAQTLRLSILMIVLPTLLIAFLPTYQTAGILAPILLTLIRMWQGISIGGEYSGNLIYLAETAPDDFRATFTSFASMGSNLGILLAALVGIITSTLFTPQQLSDWGWRIPYLISGLLCLVVYFFRMQIKETQIFIYLKRRRLLAKNPVKTVFKKDFFQLARTLGLVCMGTTFYYFCFIYLPIYLTQNLRFSVHHISIFISMLICCMIIFLPVAGFLCDKIGRRKMMLFNAGLITICVVPGFYLLHSYISVVMTSVLLLFTMASALEQGTTPIALIENFPAQARYTGVSLGYNLGNGFLGGSVPIICEWLNSNLHLQLGPALYIATCAAITWCVAYFFLPETKGKSLLK